jgi:hypothetical protein
MTGVKRLKIDEPFVVEWSDRYLGDTSGAEAALEDRLFRVISPVLRRRGHLTREELLTIGRWKSPRARSRLEENGAKRVRAITSMALAPNALERSSVLMALSGVGIPIASAILAIWDPHNYTVFDWRATETLRRAGYFDVSAGRASFGLYLSVCRDVADGLDLPDMPISKLRILDRALWKYSQAS